MKCRSNIEDHNHSYLPLTWQVYVCVYPNTLRFLTSVIFPLICKNIAMIKNVKNIIVRFFVFDRSVLINFLVFEISNVKTLFFKIYKKT